MNTARLPLSLLMLAAMATGTSAQAVATMGQRVVAGDAALHLVRFTVDEGGRPHVTREALPGVAAQIGLAHPSLDATASLPDYVSFPGRVLPGLVQADLDGDGLPDAVGEDFFDLTVSLGHGNGTFGPATHMGFENGLQFMVLGDATGDGQTDVVAFNIPFVGSPFTLDVYPGDGPSFGQPISSPAPPSVSTNTVLLADLNGDGMDDWLCNNMVSGTPEAFELDTELAAGGGAYVLQTPLPLGQSYVSSVKVADFNGDGTLDLAAAADNLDTEQVEVDVYTGLGDGTLASNPIVTPMPSSVFPSIATQDQDEDGVVDLLAVGASPNLTAPDLLVRLHGNGDGTFTDTADIPLPGAGEALWGDVNGDGVNDVIVVIGAGILEGGVDTGLATLLGDGAGGLQSPLVVGWPGQFLTPLDLEDLDGDGALDINLADCFAHGRGDGTFEGSSSIDIPFTGLSSKGPWRLAAADMNQDGDLDIVATRKKQQSGLAVMLGHGDTSFDLDPQVQPGLVDLELGDLDGDGYPDVVATGTSSVTGTRELLNDGTGTGFVAPATTVLPFSAAGIDLGDVDGDGALDLLATQAPQPDVLLLRGDGHGGFLPAQTLVAGGSAKLVDAVDLDGDGVLDVATTFAAGTTLATLAGTGGGAFAAPQVVTLPITPETIAFADFNRDGAVDIAVAFEDVYGESLHVLLAQAPGEFGPSFEIPEVWNVEALGAADIDRDGATDLVAVSSQYELLTFRNTPDGNFSSIEATRLDGANDSMVLGDFNGDGRVDVATGSSFLQLVRVTPNVLPPFPSLGYQHASGTGVPHLLTSGAAVPDEKVSFTATGIPSPAPGALFLGLEFTPQAFAGGTLVPSADVILPMRPDVSLTGRWPQLPAGTKVFAQAWFTGAGKVWATNAVEGIPGP